MVSDLPDPWLLPGHDGVRLRLPQERDVPAITAACNDPDVQWFTRVPYPYTEDDARAYVRTASEQAAERRDVLVVVVDGDETLLGSVGLSVDRRDHTGEVGYWFAPAGRGRGLAVAAVRAVVTFGIEARGVQMMHAVSATENPGSIAVLERAGFRRAGLLRQRAALGPTGDPSNARSDMVVFDLLPGELSRAE